LFAVGAPRWLGVQFQRAGETEQPRVLLASVPYALKSVDADTLGGIPASGYLLADTATNAAASAGPSAAATTALKNPFKPLISSGTVNFVGKFVNPTDVGNSALYESNGFVGIGTTAPKISLDARSCALPQMGIAQTTDYLTFFASDTFGPAIYWDPAKDMRFGKGGTGLYNANGFVEYMRIQSSTGNVGIGTLTPRTTLDVNGDFNIAGSMSKGGTLFLHNLGTRNTAVGSQALLPSFSGIDNTGVGYKALYAIGTGSANTAIGSLALQANTSGYAHIATGFGALPNNTTGSYNIALGAKAGGNITGSDNIDIANEGSANDNGAVRIGTSGNQTSFFAAGVYGVNTGLPAYNVVIDSNGQLGTQPGQPSSRRYKEDIQDMGDASSNLQRLRPVTFRYKKPMRMDQNHSTTV
jgi:hypothetical protein